jgi:hypothetical protein
MRLTMLALAGIVLVIAAVRARRLLTRAIEETRRGVACREDLADPEGEVFIVRHRLLLIGCATELRLRKWIDTSVKFVANLPPKKKKEGKPTKRRDN